MYVFFLYLYVESLNKLATRNLQTQYSVLTVAYCDSLRNTRRTTQKDIMQWALSANADCAVAESRPN